jgi:two-component system capsular synthesis response regulator RcsB
VLLDDHPVLLAAVGMLLKKDGVVEVVAELTSWRATLDLILLEEIDLLISDYQMTGMTGAGLVQRIGEANLKTQVIIMSWDHSPALVQDSFVCGARAFLAKIHLVKHLRPALLEVIAGRYYLCPASAMALARSSGPHLNNPFA